MRDSLRKTGSVGSVYYITQVVINNKNNEEGINLCGQQNTHSFDTLHFEIRELRCKIHLDSFRIQKERDSCANENKKMKHLRKQLHDANKTLMK
jgi:hypothetical protein